MRLPNWFPKEEFDSIIAHTIILITLFICLWLVRFVIEIFVTSEIEKEFYRDIHTTINTVLFILYGLNTIFKVIKGFFKDGTTKIILA